MSKPLTGEDLYNYALTWTKEQLARALVEMVDAFDRIREEIDESSEIHRSDRIIEILNEMNTINPQGEVIKRRQR